MKNIIILIALSLLSCDDNKIPPTLTLTAQKPIVFEEKREKYEIKLINLEDCRCTISKNFGGISGVGAIFTVSHLNCTGTNCHQEIFLANIQCGDRQKTIDRIKEFPNDYVANAFGLKITLWNVLPEVDLKTNEGQPPIFKLEDYKFLMSIE